MNIKLKLWHWQQWQRKVKRKNEIEKKLWRMTGVLKNVILRWRTRKTENKKKGYDVGDDKGREKG